MKALLPLHGFIEWNGGLDFARFITAALTHPALDERVDLYFALPEVPIAKRLKSALRRWWALGSSNRSVAQAGNKTELARIADKFTAGHRVVLSKDSAAGIWKAASATRADIIFPSMTPLGKSSSPWVGYLFDFQHRYLPHFFSAREIRNRDRYFARMAKEPNGIVVNSRSVAADAHQLLGVPRDRILALPFAPHVSASAFGTDPTEAKSRYGVEGHYLMICNHFWTHKDHHTALNAFALLHALFPDLRLVLTGDPFDYRDPKHYGRLVALTRKLGIHNHVHFLGLIPKRDQLALLRGCDALIQPTLFEGGPGGGSVYEAIGLGVPAVVSDIPVNLEINAGHIYFFRAGSAEDLTEKVRNLLQTPRELRSAPELLAEGQARLLDVGEAIAAFLHSLLDSTHSYKKTVAHQALS